MLHSALDIRVNSDSLFEKEREDGNDDSDKVCPLIVLIVNTPLNGLIKLDLCAYI